MHRTALLALSVLLLPGAVQAADMIAEDGYRQTRHRSAVVHAAPRHVAYAYTVCDDLLITYRPPHHPRREIVRVCHPPVPGQ